MTDKQKLYIEKNIDLIKDDDWNEFFKFAPANVGALLYEANIPFLKKLSYVPNSAFEGSNIQTIDIPDNVTNIGSHAFAACSGLTNVTIPDSVTSIDTFAFYNCTKLTSVTIPNSVTKINNYAFAHCYSLTSMNIPDSVTDVGVGVFRDCGELDIHYTGTKDKWKQLFSNGNEVFKGTKYTCACTDGIVKKAR